MQEKKPLNPCGGIEYTPLPSCIARRTGVDWSGFAGMVAFKQAFCAIGTGWVMTQTANGCYITLITL